MITDLGVLTPDPVTRELTLTAVHPGIDVEQVRERAIPYECGVARFRETSRGHIMGLHAGLMKLIFALDTRRLLGVHIIGPV